MNEAEIEEVVNAALASPASRAIIAKEITRELRQRLGGEGVYFPKTCTREKRAESHDEIRRLFTNGGVDKPTLEKQFRLRRRTLNRILYKAK